MARGAPHDRRRSRPIRFLSCRSFGLRSEALCYCGAAGGWPSSRRRPAFSFACSANLLDGMVAIEGGKSTPSGALFNEIPDRVADPLFLVPLGYAAGYSWLGWLAALLAVLTAYIRVLGGALGQQQDFGGILPKQRRMAVLTIALLAAAIEV